MFNFHQFLWESIAEVTAEEISRRKPVAGKQVRNYSRGAIFYSLVETENSLCGKTASYQVRRNKEFFLVVVVGN